MVDKIGTETPPIYGLSGNRSKLQKCPLCQRPVKLLLTAILFESNEQIYLCEKCAKKAKSRFCEP